MEKKLDKKLFALIAAGAIAILAVVAFLPVSLGGIGNLWVKILALVVVFPALLGTATAQIYRSCRPNPRNNNA